MNIKRQILEALYLADFNVRYHDYLCRRYSFWDVVVKMILALLAVSFFAGKSLKPEYVNFWQTLAGTVALVSTTVVPLLKWNKLIPRIETERLRWIQLKNEYVNLWTDSKEDGDWENAKKELRKLRKKDNATEAGGGLIPEHAGLINKARKDVVTSFRASLVV